MVTARCACRCAGSANTRLRALTILVRAVFPDAPGLIRRAVAEGDPASTTSVLRLAGELQAADADAATELEPRASRLREELIALVSDDNPSLRYWAITLLARAMSDPPVALAVASRAADDDANVRAAAAEALGCVDARIARPLLRKLLRDDAFFVRAHAARSVAKVGDGSLAGKLLPLLGDRNWWVRAAASLQHLGGDGLDVARAALGHEDRFARDGALEIIL
jgi:HEAT repeat protein